METEPQREPPVEIPLMGGQLTPGIVCVGDTVRRRPKGHVAFVHDLLVFLEDQGFPFAPRVLGMDEQGREILSYLEGESWPDSSSGLSDDLLEQAARAIRRSRDATAGSSLAHGSEIVAHHELGPHNTIFQDRHLVGFIDWDDAAPGTRLHDLANAVYNYVDVSHWSNQEANEQARRIRLSQKPMPPLLVPADCGTLPLRTSCTTHHADRSCRIPGEKLDAL